jgi:hypothetical protein
VIANPTGLDSQLLLIGLDNCQTNLILFVDANPIKFGLWTQTQTIKTACPSRSGCQCRLL